ncbi:TrmH family RNA methyltransferase, partial [Patescibacteria group bacterium]
MKYNIIQSKDNEKIKTLRKLQTKKYRSKLELFCVENYTIFVDALKDGFVPESLFVTNEFLDKNKEELERVLGDAGMSECVVITREINGSFSSLDTPSGVCAVYKKKEKAVELNESVIYLNAVSDPGNLGTILRSALAFGFENIVLDDMCVDLYNPKTVQALKGANFNLNISFDRNLKILNQIKDEMKIISTDVEKGEDAKEFSIDEKFCLVLGNETRGVDENVREMADVSLNIKISPKIESLNVSSSA